MVLLERPEQPWTLEGCCNLRDLGGHRGDQGRRISRGRLLRSDSLAAASDADRHWLGSKGLATIIDLRSDTEVLRSGSCSGVALTTYRLPLGTALDDVGPIRWDDPEAVATHYFELLLASADSVCEALAVLSDPTALPAAIHCTFGKDRTGVVVALTLSLLGVPAEVIVADYTLSGIGAARLALRLRAELADRPTEFHAMLPALLSAAPETMRLFLTKIRAEFGSARGYVDHHGIAGVVEDLRGALLEPARPGARA